MPRAKISNKGRVPRTSKDQQKQCFKHEALINFNEHTKENLTHAKSYNQKSFYDT